MGTAGVRGAAANSAVNGPVNCAVKMEVAFESVCNGLRLWLGGLALNVCSLEGVYVNGNESEGAPNACDKLLLVSHMGCKFTPLAGGEYWFLCGGSICAKLVPHSLSLTNG